MVGLLSPYLMGPAQSLSPMAGPATGSMGGGMGFPAPPPVPQQRGIGGFLSNFNMPDQATRLQMAAQMMSAPTFGQSLGGAFGVMGQRKAEQQQQNTTRMWLSSMGLAPHEVDAAMGNPAILNHLLKTKAGGAESDVRFGLNPIYGQDPETGETVLGTLGTDGSFKKIETGGFKVSTGIDKIDAGTHWVLQDKRSGQTVGTLPKENFRESFDKAAGGEAGKTAVETAGAIPGARAAAATVRAQVDDLKNDPYLPRMVGPIDSRLPNVSADAARVQSKMDQLQGGAFLQGRQLLKGGGAITDFESTKAEQALVRMNAAQSEADFKAALEDFAQAVEQGVAKLEAAARNNPAGQQAPQQQRLRFNPATGDFE